MKAGSYPHAKAALDDIFAACDNKPLRVAKALGIDDAHAYIYRKHKRITPKMRRTLEDRGYVETPPKRIRSHVEHGYGDEGRRHKERVRKFYIDAGYDNLTDWIHSLVEVDE